MVYAAQKDEKWFVVIDGKEGKKYDGIGSLMFNPETNQIAYIAMKGKKFLIITDDNESSEYDIFGGMAFSEDGKHFGYIAGIGETFFCVIDGQKSQEYDTIAQNSLIFSPNGERSSFIAVKDDVLNVV